MPHRVLHIQQDHPAQAEQECGHAAVPQDAIWCPINADEVRYVDVLREHGKDVVNNFGDEEDTDRYNAVLRDIDGDVPEVDINAIKHLVEAKRRDAQLTHKDRIVPSTGGGCNASLGCNAKNMSPIKGNPTICVNGQHQLLLSLMH